MAAAWIRSPVCSAGGSLTRADEGQVAPGRWLFPFTTQTECVPLWPGFPTSVWFPGSSVANLSQPDIGRHASRALPTRNQNTTLNNGYLGSRNDEERSEMRYLV